MKEIKQGELEALEREVDGLKTALGTRTLIGKAIGPSSSSEASTKPKLSRC